MNINTQEIKTQKETKMKESITMYKMEIRINDKNPNKINVHNIKFTDKLIFIKETKEKTMWFRTANGGIDCYLKIPDESSACYTQYLKQRNNDTIEGMEQLVLFITVKMPQNSKPCYIFCNKEGTKSYYFM